MDKTYALTKATYFTHATEEVGGALLSSDWKDPQVINDKYTVRRLTPLECCRLQGFPDWWCDGVEGSDTAQYKMWGNGVALPCVLYIMEGIAECEEE